jgi:hypothetical protein
MCGVRKKKAFHAIHFSNRTRDMNLRERPMRDRASTFVYRRDLDVVSHQLFARVPLACNPVNHVYTRSPD